MADQILSPVVGKLLECFAVLVERQFSYLFRYNGNLEEFRSQFEELKNEGGAVKLLVEASERNGEVILPNVEHWLRSVDAVSKESERFFEEEVGVSKCCFNGPPNPKVRYQRSRRAKKKASELDKLRKDGKFDRVACPAPPLQIGFVNNVNEFDFESRRLIFGEIMDAIKDDGVEMIGIWGMPGIGKTTLVKRVARYAVDEGLFEAVAMAVVSQNPSVKGIQGEIADMIDLKFTSESEGGRARELLRRLLAMKKVLVILDDIWDSLELNDIGIPSGSQHKGCKVILTSRILDVCEEMRSGKNFKIDLLSENEALDLFQKMSGVNDRSSEKLRSLAEKLTEECNRLPIAIAIVARALLNKRLIYWDDTLSLLRKSHPNRKLRATIELSYNYLYHEEEKTFFLLCALFPEDYEIPVRVLFEYGIGLDLFEKVNNVDEALVRAQKVASSLVSSSLLLDGVWKKYVKMHDAVRDVALAIASEGKNAFLVQSEAQWREWPKKTAVSLCSDDIKNLPDTLECTQLQILILQSERKLQLHDNFFAGMKNLVVLDMSKMEFVRLPQSLAGLKNLQTLRLTNCELGDISMIGKLQKLVSLSFYDSDIEVLPKEVGELSNLRLLDLSRCFRLKVIAPGVIQNLSHLEVLYMPLRYGEENDLSKTNASVSELIHLSRLMILEIRISNAGMLPEEELFGNLTKFKVSIGRSYFHPISIFSRRSKILCLLHLSEKVLSKAGIKMLMKKAQHLELVDISGLSVALPSHLGGYESLKVLIVRNCKNVNYVLDMNGSEYELETPSLQNLHLMKLPLLKEISRGKSVALTNLTTVDVESCDELKYIFDQSTAKSLLKLKKLSVGNCKNMQAIYLNKEEEQDEAIVFRQLSELNLRALENLASFGSKLSSESTLFGEQVIFPALEKLDIDSLEKLEKIWHIHTPVELFFQLKVLKVADCPQLLSVFPPQSTSTLQNLKEIRIEDCECLETLFQSDGVPLAVGDEMILFPRLVILKLVNLPKLTTLLSTTSQNISQDTVIFSAMEIMTLSGLDNLKSILDQRLNFFPKLKKLELEGDHRLSSIGDQLHKIKGIEGLEELKINYNYGGRKENLQIIATLPKLMKLEFCSNEERIEWSDTLYRCKGFQNLTSLNFYNCNGLKNLLTPLAVSCLVQLQELFVTESETMESIVEDMIGEQNFDKVIKFSKLHTLRLDNLPHLTSFYNGECALKFPCLDEISIKICSQLKTFTLMTRATPELSSQNFVLFGRQVSFGRLRCLTLERLELIEEIWHRDHPATTVGELSRLEVESCDRLLNIFPSNLLAGLQKLGILRVRSCESLEHVFAVEEHSPVLSSLDELHLYKLPKLKQLWWNENSCGSFGLPSLRYFSMASCPGLRFVFDASVADSLENLNRLSVEDCSLIVEIVPEKPGEKIMFPLLETLHLENLPCFKGSTPFAELPQAEHVFVKGCFNMKEPCVLKVKHLRNTNQLSGSMSIFKSCVERELENR